jgi:hypothetical protein
VVDVEVGHGSEGWTKDGKGTRQAIKGSFARRGMHSVHGEGFALHPCSDHCDGGDRQFANTALAKFSEWIIFKK